MLRQPLSNRMFFILQSKLEFFKTDCVNEIKTVLKLMLPLNQKKIVINCVIGFKFYFFQINFVK